MRALAINSMFVNAMYRRCADELGALPDIDLTIFMPHSWKMNRNPLSLDPLHPGSPYRMLTGNTVWKGFENRGFYISGLIRAFQQSRPEVLYLMEEPFSLFSLETMFVKKLLRLDIPTVFFTWNNLSLSKFDYRPSLFYHTVARQNLREFTRGVTANSDGIRVLREAGFRGPVSTIGYAVDTQTFASVDQNDLMALRNSLQIREGERVIGYVGRLLKMKGIDLLLEAFAGLKREGEENLKLLFLGSGEDEAFFLREAERMGISADVRHVRTVVQEAVPLYMHLIDTLVLPSRRRGMWAEQFGRVLVEAMAAGKIVLGSTSGAIPEVIGKAGFTFQENDAEDLKAKLRRILKLSVQERDAIIAIARDRAANYYSWKRFAERSARELRAAMYEPSREARGFALSEPMIEATA